MLVFFIEKVSKINKAACSNVSSHGNAAYLLKHYSWIRHLVKKKFVFCNMYTNSKRVSILSLHETNEWMKYIPSTEVNVGSPNQYETNWVVELT